MTAIRSALIFLLTITVFHIVGAGQSCKKVSFDTDLTFGDADANLVLNHVEKYRKFRGTVPVERNLPTVIEIFSISAHDMQTDMTFNETRGNLFKKIITDEKGDFCLDELAVGNYFLKIRTSGGGSRIYVRIAISNEGTKKPIKI